MKSVTEFLIPKLAEGVKVKAALAGEGKTPEEIAAAMGEKFKFEGDKLKCFVNAVEIASQSTEKLFRIIVVKLNEGQTTPHRGTIIEDLCYITEAQTNLSDLKKTDGHAASPANSRGGRSGKGGNRGGKSGGKPAASPWGISPEEKEAKLASARKAAREKSLAGKA